MRMYWQRMCVKLLCYNALKSMSFNRQGLGCGLWMNMGAWGRAPTATLYTNAPTLGRCGLSGTLLKNLFLSSFSLISKHHHYITEHLFLGRTNCIFHLKTSHQLAKYGSVLCCRPSASWVHLAIPQKSHLELNACPPTSRMDWDAEVTMYGSSPGSHLGQSWHMPVVWL